VIPICAGSWVKVPLPRISVAGLLLVRWSVWRRGTTSSLDGPLRPALQRSSRGYNGGTLIEPFQRSLRHGVKQTGTRRKSCVSFFFAARGGKGAHLSTLRKSKFGRARASVCAPSSFRRRGILNSVRQTLAISALSQEDAGLPVSFDPLPPRSRTLCLSHPTAQRRRPPQ
jgi:hypothetical protein